jgi:hypothetical protein
MAITVFYPGLPDGLFSNEKSKFGSILEVLRMENDGIFYVPWEYITAIWHTLSSFGNFVVICYIFPRFGILSQEKSGKPDFISLASGKEIMTLNNKAVRKES